MSELLSGVSTFVTQAISWMWKFLGQIVSVTEGDGGATYAVDPVLAIFIIALPLVGLGIGLLRRLIHTRG